MGVKASGGSAGVSGDATAAAKGGDRGADGGSMEGEKRVSTARVRDLDANPLAKAKYGGVANHRMLDDTDQAFAMKTVKMSVSKRIQQARTAKGIKQAALAKLINETPAVVMSYESGSAVPTNAVL